MYLSASAVKTEDIYLQRGKGSKQEWQLVTENVTEVKIMCHTFFIFL